MSSSIYNDIRNLDITKWQNKAISDVQNSMVLWNTTTEHMVNGSPSTTFAIGTSGMATEHIPGSDVTASQLNLRKETIVLKDWNAGAYLDVRQLSQMPFDYQSMVTNSMLPDMVAKRRDQSIIRAMNDATVPTVQYNADLTQLFGQVRATMDSQTNPMPEEDRYAVIPTQAIYSLLTNPQLMNSDYISKMVADLADGKMSRLVGFEFKKMPNREGGGLTGVKLADGTTMWTCYAYSKKAVHSGIGYGGTHDQRGSGGVLQVVPMEWKQAIFVNMPFSSNDKVCLPQGVVRFYLKTPTVEIVNS